MTQIIRGLGIVVAGATNVGKTSYVAKRFLGAKFIPYNNPLKPNKKHRPILDPESGLGKEDFEIFDPHKDYTDFVYEDYTLPTIKEFTKAATKAENKEVLYEEASIFFRHQQTSEDTFAVMVGKQHKNINVIFCFHSLRLIPMYILDFCDELVLFRTNDMADFVHKEKFKNVIPIRVAYNEVNNSPHLYEHRVVKVNDVAQNGNKVRTLWQN